MLIHIAKIVLGPILIRQGKYVRNSTPLLPEPSGAREGSCGEGMCISVLVLGDSAAAGVGAKTQDDALSGNLSRQLALEYRVYWELIAKTGATTRSTSKKISTQKPRIFDIVIISLGVNDVTSMVGLKLWLAQQEKLLLKVQETFTPSMTIICGLPPVHRFPVLPQPLRWYLGKRAKLMSNALQKKLECLSEVVFLPLNFADDLSLMAADGFHPGPEAYTLWAQQLAGLVHKYKDRFMRNQFEAHDKFGE